MKMTVYNMKESIEEKEENRKKIKSTQKKVLRTKELNLFQKKKLIVIVVLIHL